MVRHDQQPERQSERTPLRGERRSDPDHRVDRAGLHLQRTVPKQAMDAETPSTISRTSLHAGGLDSLREDLSKVYERLLAIEHLLALVPLLLAQSVDSTHLTIEAAARLVGVSTKKIRRRIANGTLTYELIPSTRRHGIPVEALYTGWWIPVSVAKSIIDEERRALEKLKGKS